MGEFEAQEPGGIEDKEAQEEAFVANTKAAAEAYHINTPDMKRILEQLWMNSSSTPSDTESTKE
ncbi:MAG: hypothetical protein AAB669_02320 [Patescibacteria group bacterium]